MSRKKLGVLIFAVLAGASMIGWVVAVQSAEKAEKRPIVIDKAPVRIIQDPYPTFNGIAVEPERGEVIMTDDNRASILVYSSQFTPTERVMEPLRYLGGLKTHLTDVCSLSISPEYKEIYTVNNDRSDNMCVFPLEAKGDVVPLRELNVEHGAWGIFLDRKNEELVITTQDTHMIAVYHRLANGDEKRLRLIQGPHTGLADPHGVYVDSENNEIFIANHGFWHKAETGDIYYGTGETRKKKPLGPSTGKFLPPSITVYSRTAHGDVTPLRTIQGSKTQLNLPLGIYLDTVSNQIAVANAGDDSILFFDRKANGNVAPVRVLKGPATGLDGPSGLFMDPKRNEIWVTNWDSHTATAYSRTAEGNVAPLRTIRGAPKNVARALGFGKPSSVAYDPKRKQILVAN